MNEKGGADGALAPNSAVSSSSSVPTCYYNFALHDQNDCQLTMCRLYPSSTTTSTTISAPTRRSLNDETLHYYSNMDGDSSESDCHQIHRKEYQYRSSLIPTRDSKEHLTDMSTQLDADTQREEKASYYSQLQRSFSSILPRVSLVRLSVCLLACATLFDMALTNIHNTTDRPTRVSLGSAAISSVTDTLSPILPFAGGLDLRRDDYWLVSDGSTWLKTLQSVIAQVQDAFAAKEEASHVSNSNKKSSKHAIKTHDSAPRTKRNTKSSSLSSYEMAISAPQPFVSLETIAQLTLGDIGECFRYAMESSNADYSETRFFSQSSSIGSSSLRQVIHGMHDAVNRSRGKSVVDWTRPVDGTSSSNNDKDASVDALKFSAAMRVFAEWRLLRQVPDGYKGFAIGMSLGHKDVVQNIIKIEESVHNYMDHQLDSCHDELAVMSVDCKRLQTPTLRELLLYEIETGVHPTQRLPYLKEKSAGMGLLWVRRQLAYQTQIFDNVLHMKDGESMKNAVGAAYSQVYDQYHGWAVQKIFTYSFQAAPEAEEILRHMNPRRLQELIAEQRRQKRSSASVDTGNDTRHRQDGMDSDSNVIVQVIDHIGGEWDKLAYNVVRIFNKDAEPPQSMMKAEDQSVGVTDSSLTIDEVFVTNEMVKDAHLQIQMYLQRIQPILQSIQLIFQDLNMDDPTRV